MDIGKVQEFFFRAMVEGWAAGAPKIQVSELPGFKYIIFEEGDYRLVDGYQTSKNSPHSSGMTTISFQGSLVWQMSYGGFYEERVIPFLQRMLQQTYRKQSFCGGRGPFRAAEGNLVYLNEPRVNNFVQFDGREKIVNATTGVCLGFHGYWGTLLL